MSMHGLDVTCLPDLLIFVLSLKINYFVHFLNNLVEKHSVLHYRKTVNFVFRNACSKIMMWYGSSSLSQLCGGIFNRSPGIHFLSPPTKSVRTILPCKCVSIDSEKYLGKCIF